MTMTVLVCGARGASCIDRVSLQPLLYGGCRETKDATDAYLAGKDLGVCAAYLAHANGILDCILTMADPAVSLPAFDLQAPEPLPPAAGAAGDGEEEEKKGPDDVAEDGGDEEEELAGKANDGGADEEEKEPGDAAKDGGDEEEEEPSVCIGGGSPRG